VTTDPTAAEYARGLAELDWLDDRSSLTRAERRALCDRPVTLPDGRVTTWGDATAADLRAIDCYARRHAGPHSTEMSS
jgi:hypothetical protein